MFTDEDDGGADDGDDDPEVHAANVMASATPVTPKAMAFSSFFGQWCLTSGRILIGTVWRMAARRLVIWRDLALGVPGTSAAGSLDDPLRRLAQAFALFRVTAARTSVFNAFSLIFSPSWKSMARLTFPSRLELKRPEGSFRAAPFAKVIFTTSL